MSAEVGAVKPSSPHEASLSPQDLAWRSRGEEAPSGALRAFDGGDEPDHKKASLSKENLKSVVEALNGVAEAFNRFFRFEYVEEIDRFWVKVVDRRTHKVIREIPPGQIVELFKRIRETVGVLFDELF